MNTSLRFVSSLLDRSVPRRSLLLGSIIGIFGAASLPAQAANWPTDKPIRIVVPFGAGGSGDVAIRMIQPHLEKLLGASIFIDNKTGASGNIGATDVARATPDGYTFLLGATNNYVMNQFLFKLPFDPVKDLTPVTLLVNSPLVIMTNLTVPAKTLPEFITHLKKNPNSVNFGSPGPGTAPHLAGLRFNELTGSNLVHVGFRGMPPAVQALMANDIQAMFVTADSTSGHVVAGRLRALAVAGTQRLSALPGVPTAEEAGLGSFVIGNWWGLSAPKGLDPQIANRMAAAIREVVSRPEIAEQFARNGALAVASTPAAFMEHITKESGEWKSLIQKSNISLD